MGAKICFFCMDKNELQAAVARELQLQERSEDWKRSIPAQIFLNYFFSIHYLIRQSADAYDLTKLDPFQQLDPRRFKERLTEGEQASIRQHLLNAWNTEYAMRTTALLADPAYLRNALHWTFPQVYYSAYESLQAFLRLQGISRRLPEDLQREAGGWIARGAYPAAISFYASGHPLKPRLHGLEFGRYKPSLQMEDLETEAQAQLGQFLRTTRKASAQQLREEIQRNPATALRSEHTGNILQRFTDEHWKQLNWRIGHTTIFSFLLRLRISANHREITRFVEADIDFNLFHRSLEHLLGYLNFIHEAYVAKALGLEAYSAMVKNLPDYLQKGFVQERLEDWIAPLFDDQQKVA